MSAGLVIDVRFSLSTEAGPEATPVEVTHGNDLRARYDRQMAQVMRMGSWLNGPHAQLLPRDAWEQHYGRYQEHLEKLRRMGDELRPTTLRDRHEPLTGDALVSEVTELFAA